MSNISALGVLKWRCEFFLIFKIKLLTLLQFP
jgi:hypothetical protein